MRNNAPESEVLTINGKTIKCSEYQPEIEKPHEATYFVSRHVLCYIAKYKATIHSEFVL
ncbi:MAG: hypothetical protein ACTTJ3_07150 [Treponema sp.]